MQFQMLVEPRQANEALERRSTHLEYVFEPQMIGHQRGGLFSVVS